MNEFVGNIIEAFAKAIVCTLAFGGAFVGVQSLMGGVTDAQFTNNPEREMTPAEKLIEKHDCYTGNQENPGYIPGHAIITRDGVTHRASADVGFDIWLHDGRGTVHAFCR